MSRECDPLALASRTAIDDIEGKFITFQGQKHIIGNFISRGDTRLVFHLEATGNSSSLTKYVVKIPINEDRAMDPRIVEERYQKVKMEVERFGKNFLDISIINVDGGFVEVQEFGGAVAEDLLVDSSLPAYKQAQLMPRAFEIAPEGEKEETLHSCISLKKSIMESDLLMDPLDSEKWAIYAVPHCWEQQFNTALRLVERAILLQRNSSTFEYFRSQILSKLGRDEEALESIKRTLVLRPSFSEALRDLFKAVVEQLCYSRMEEEFAHCNVYLSPADRHEVETCLRRKLTAHQSAEKLLKKAAESLLLKGDFSYALSLNERALEADSTNPFALCNAVLLSRHLGSDYDINNYLEALWLARPTDPRVVLTAIQLETPNHENSSLRWYSLLCESNVIKNIPTEDWLFHTEDYGFFLQGERIGIWKFSHEDFRRSTSALLTSFLWEEYLIGAKKQPHLEDCYSFIHTLDDRVTFYGRCPVPLYPKIKFLACGGHLRRFIAIKADLPNSFTHIATEVDVLPHVSSRHYLLKITYILRVADSERRIETLLKISRDELSREGLGYEGRVHEALQKGFNLNLLREVDETLCNSPLRLPAHYYQEAGLIQYQFVSDVTLLSLLEGLAHSRMLILVMHSIFRRAAELIFVPNGLDGRSEQFIAELQEVNSDNPMFNGLWRAMGCSNTALAGVSVVFSSLLERSHEALKELSSCILAIEDSGVIRECDLESLHAEFGRSLEALLDHAGVDDRDGAREEARIIKDSFEGLRSGYHGAAKPHHFLVRDGEIFIIDLGSVEIGPRVDWDHRDLDTIANAIFLQCDAQIKGALDTIHGETCLDNLVTFVGDVCYPIEPMRFFDPHISECESICWLSRFDVVELYAVGVQE